jgi:aryl-alcohol dehydrogenase-like predicted oxidoreductase
MRGCAGLAGETGVQVSALCLPDTANNYVLAWLMARTPSAIPLIAASNEIQLDDNLGALAVEAEQLATLDAASA